tara:strand:- start:208 stop:582 length:375 start_codon:yes stop_codon:yes gene_type:complete
MAYFAEIDDSNVVLRVLVLSDTDTQDENGVEVEEIGQEYFHNSLGGTWIQTSKSNAFRKNYAGIGHTYDEIRDAFIPPKPFPSWTLKEDTCLWEAPTARPDDGKFYSWNEDTTSWDLINDGWEE